MKCQISKNGELMLYAENETEYYALGKWHKEFFESDKKETKSIDTTKITEEKGKPFRREVNFLTEVLACIAWTTKA